jgi:hypothetical protein
VGNARLHQPRCDDTAAFVLHGRFLRVMKKQRDASWRYTRIMWQQDKT